MIGIEGDASWTDFKGDGPCVAVFNCTAKNKWLADVTGRLGIAVDHALLYVKGGWALGGYDYDANLNLIGPPNNHDTLIALGLQPWAFFAWL